MAGPLWAGRRFPTIPIVVREGLCASSPHATFPVSLTAPLPTHFVTSLSLLKFFCLFFFCNENGLFYFTKPFFSIPNLLLSFCINFFIEVTFI